MRMGISGELKLVLVVAVALVLIVPTMFASGILDVDGIEKSASTTTGSTEGIVGSDSSIYENFTSNFIVRANPRMMAVGDLNDDGRTDIAVIYYGILAVDIYYQSSNGSFSDSPDLSIATTAAPTYLTLGDLNNDGLSDVLICYRSGTVGRIEVFYHNSGSDGFGSSGTIPIGTGRVPVCIAVADLDGNDLNDIIAVTVVPGAVYSGRLVTIRNDSELLSLSTVGTNISMTSPNMLAVGDFDQDSNHRIDVAIGSTSDNRVIVYRNTIVNEYDDNAWEIKANFTSANNVVAPKSIEFIDSDASGIPVLAIASSGKNTVLMYKYNTTKAAFEAGKHISTNSGLSYAGGIYLNDDDLEDVVIAYGSSSNITYYYTPQTKDGYGSPAGSFPCQSNFVMMDSANMTATSQEQYLIALQNSSATNGAITLSYSINGVLTNANENLIVSMNQSSLIAGNFSKTSNDIAVLSGSTLSIYNKGVWRYITAPLPVEKGYSMSLFDQSYDDIVLLNASMGKVYIYPSSTSIFIGGHGLITLDIPSPLTRPSSVTAADENGDGYVDLIIGCEGGFVIFYNSGIGSGFSSTNYSYVQIAVSSIQWIMAGGFNVGTDGLTDIAIINPTNNSLDIFYQRPSGARYSTSSTLSIPITGTIVYAAASVVYPNDGYVDIIVGVEDRVDVYYQSWGNSYGFDSLDVKTCHSDHGVSSVAVGDYDDDGLNEIAYVGSKMNSVFLVQFSGSSFRLDYLQTAGAGSSFIAIADGNGDNRNDIIVGSNASHSISIWHQRNLVPHATWDWDPKTVAEGSNIGLTVTSHWDSYSDNSSLTYSWSQRLSSVSTWTSIGSTTDQTITYSFGSQGLYYVSLKVTDRSGAASWSNQTITVNDASPTASFTYSGTMVENTTVTFADHSTSPADEIVYFEWDFGDGSTHVITSSSATLATHAYQKNGTYTAILTIRDYDGSENTTSRSVSIIDGSPIFTISSTSTTINENDSITFTLRQASPDGLKNIKWSINGVTVDDGLSYSIIYKFLNNGSYDLAVTATDIDGNATTVSSTITVYDTTPTASFTVSKTQVNEGDAITFQSTSKAYDGIKSWYWQFSDGTTATGQSVVKSFAQQGLYSVTLTVTDNDNSAVSVTRMDLITVNDTDPSVGTLATSSGATSFDKGVAVTFTAPVVKGAEEPTYTWTISGAGTPYVTSTDDPVLVYTFGSAGTYTVTLKVNDSDNYVLKSIQITIVDEPPVAKFIVEHIDYSSLKIVVSANMTTDIDDESLNYSWNFGDGSAWTDWSAQPYCGHTYDSSKVYTVMLRVKDPVTTSYYQLDVIVDNALPDIELTNMESSSYVGDPIEIHAHVSDATSVTVRLYYSYDGVDFSNFTVMTATDNFGNYSGQIPTPEDTGTIWYYISATDLGNHTRTTDALSIKIEEEPSYLFVYVLILALAIASIIALIYLIKTRPVVDEVFVIYHDGNLIAHQARRMKPGMDDQILGSMFVALQGFVKDSFKDESSTILKRMDFGDKKIMVEKGDFVYIAVVLNGKRAESIPPRMQKVLEEIDDRYGIELIAWDGDLEKLRGVKNITTPLFKRGKFIDLSRRNGKKNNG